MSSLWGVATTSASISAASLQRDGTLPCFVFFLYRSIDWIEVVVYIAVENRLLRVLWGIHCSWSQCFHSLLLESLTLIHCSWCRLLHHHVIHLIEFTTCTRRIHSLLCQQPNVRRPPIYTPPSLLSQTPQRSTSSNLLWPLGWSQWFRGCLATRRSESFFVVLRNAVIRSVTNFGPWSNPSSGCFTTKYLIGL